MEAANSTDNQTDLAPPYVSFTTLRNAIERMESEGDVPAQVDRSYLSNLPWSAQNEFMAACRSLGLVDANDAPTDLLKELVHKPDIRKELMRSLVEARYPGPLKLGKNATSQQLENEFKKFDVTGSTLQKAIRFFLHAAQYAEITLSPHFKTPKAGTPPRRRRTQKKEEPAKPPEEQPRRQPPPPSDNAPEIIRNLLKQLPREGSKWSRAKADNWLAIARSTFDLVYRWEEDDKAKPAAPNANGGEQP
jgi:hypothetical protein